MEDCEVDWFASDCCKRARFLQQRPRPLAAPKSPAPSDGQGARFFRAVQQIDSGAVPARNPISKKRVSRRRGSTHAGQKSNSRKSS